MAIKSFPNKQAYDSAVKPTIESQVSLIETTREIIVDGVNVITTSPIVGDLVFLNESNEITFVKGGSWIRKAIIPSAWVHVGYVYFRKGSQVGVVHKDGADQKWLDIAQYSITAIAQTDITITVRMAPSWRNVVIPITLASTDINAANAQAISEAVVAKAIEAGDTVAWWAYLGDADGNKVDSDGTQIIVQRDSYHNNSLAYIFATGCTAVYSSWGDMPAIDYYWRGAPGAQTNNLGVMNIARTKAWATGSGRVPTVQEPVGPRAGNDAPVRPSAFADSEFCANLRVAYKTYEEYLKKCYAVYPYSYGCFALPTGKEMAEKYARKSAPTKDGGTKYVYPALYYGYNQSFGVDGLGFGDWYLPGVAEGAMLMRDETLAALAPNISKMGTTAINNSTSRWFAERYNTNGAWIFNGNGGLATTAVYGGLRCQAVALLEID